MKYLFYILAMLIVAACTAPNHQQTDTVPTQPTPPTVNIIFASGSAEISAIQSALINTLAERAGAADMVLIVGHTDTFGSTDENLALSKARAEAVAQALSQAGLTTSQMTTEAFGESRLRVQTPDQTRNIANNRVEVTIIP